MNNLDVYTYIYQNYEETYKFNLIEELNKGPHLISLPKLFSGIKGIYPVSDELITGSSVDFKWVGNVDDYQILLSTDKEFTNLVNAEDQSSSLNRARLPGFFILILILSSVFIRKGRKMLVAGVFILLFAGGCDKDKVDLPDAVSTIEHTKTVSGLLPNRNYYWKIIASDKNGYKTESQVYNFMTSGF